MVHVYLTSRCISIEYGIHVHINFGETRLFCATRYVWMGCVQLFSRQAHKWRSENHLWDINRYLYENAKSFVNQFIRQNSARTPADDIRTEELIIAVKLTANERAL
jgi:hypothetical protein